MILKQIKSLLKKDKSAPDYHFLLIRLAKIKTSHRILDTKAEGNHDLSYAESRRTCGLFTPRPKEHHPVAVLRVTDTPLCRFDYQAVSHVQEVTNV